MICHDGQCSRTHLFSEFSCVNKQIVYGIIVQKWNAYEINIKQDHRFQSCLTAGPAEIACFEDSSKIDPFVIEQISNMASWEIPKSPN